MVKESAEEAEAAQGGHGVDHGLAAATVAQIDVGSGIQQEL